MKEVMWIDTEFLLRDSLKSFVILGDGPVGAMKVQKYKDRMKYLQKSALTDESLVEELAFANWFSPDEAPNGIGLTMARGEEVDWLAYTIRKICGEGPSVELMVLDPRCERMTFPSQVDAEDL